MKPLILTGLKPLPSRNKQFLESPWVWIKEKAQQDQERTGYSDTNYDRVPHDMWCVEGSYYDLTPYMSSHPGGKDFLELTRGQDVTELFNTHHLDQLKVRDVLNKYFKGTSARSYQPIFSFDGFYRTMQVKVLTHFRNKKSHWNGCVSTKAVAYAALACFAVAYYQLCYTLMWQYAILCGFMLHVFYGLGHAFMHLGSGQPLRYLHDLTLQSSYHWMVTHCISHHHYINTSIDIEASALEPHENFIRSSHTNHFAIYATSHLVQFYVSAAEFVSKIIFILNGSEKIRFEYSFPVIEFVILLISTSYSLGQTAGSHLTSWYQTNLLCETLLTFPVHRTSYSYSDGCSVPPLPDFGLYCVQTTHDYHTTVPFPLNLLLFEAFNDHVLHHMFPTIDISKYSELNKLLCETLQEYGCSHLYQNNAFSDLRRAHVKLICRTKGDECYEPINRKK